MTSDMLRTRKSRATDGALVVSSHGSRASVGVGNGVPGVGRRASVPETGLVVGLRLGDSVKKKTKKLNGDDRGAAAAVVVCWSRRAREPKDAVVGVERVGKFGNGWG